MELNENISAVITGGASGLGAATARALAAKGVKVALFDMNAEKGEALAAECRVEVLDPGLHLPAEGVGDGEVEDVGAEGELLLGDVELHLVLLGGEGRGGVPIR